MSIEDLCDDILLNVFHLYLRDTPRFWPRLVWVCQKWRQIVLTSPLGLDLRLHCTYGTPVLKTLGFWPRLPIIIRYGGLPNFDPPALNDDDNIISALTQFDRVCSIGLTVTRSLLEKLSAISESLSELEELALLSHDTMELTLPSTFRWGPRLRTLRSTRVAFPVFPQLLSPSQNLVDLHLHNPLDHFSIEVLTDALSGLAQLRSMSLHFSSTTSYVFPPSPPSQRVVLSTLTRLLFRGMAEYLERLVLEIDAPRLGDIQVTVVDKSVFCLARLGDFIDRIEMRKSYHHARILGSENAVSISLMQPGALTCFKLQLFSEQLSEQQRVMFRIIPHFSAFYLNVEDLCISATRPSSQKHSLCSDRWAELVDSFSGVKWLHLDGNDSTNIVCALEDAYWQGKAVLPALHKLYLPQRGPRHAPLSEAVVAFMTSRWRSGYPIGVEYRRPYGVNELRGTLQYMHSASTLHTNGSETGPFPEPVTVYHEALSNDILLNIFRQYLDVTPQLWPILTHVCRRWQQVILGSPLGLQLRLYCTHGTPVLKNLDCWPPVPLVINYGGHPMLSPPASEDDDNIIAALKQSDRVNSIILTLTNSLSGKLSAISEPLSELEELVLVSRDNLQLTLPSAFRWGSRLRTLNVTRIAIPSLPQLLSSSTDLIDLQLQEIPMAGYFSPQVFANALSGASHLRSLSLHFLSFPPHRNYVSLPLPGSHFIVLPVLTSFKYRGISKYLDRFIAGIQAPCLRILI